MGGQKSGKHRGRQRDKGGGCRNGRGRAALFSDRSGEELAFSKKKKKKRPSMCATLRIGACV